MEDPGFDEVMKATQNSVEKWFVKAYGGIEETTKSASNEDCPLCILFDNERQSDDCSLCPIYQVNRASCYNARSPYKQWLNNRTPLTAEKMYNHILEAKKMYKKKHMQELKKTTAKNKKQEEIITIELPRPFVKLLLEFTGTSSSIEEKIGISQFDRINNTDSLYTRIKQALGLEEYSDLSVLDWVYENKK